MRNPLNYHRAVVLTYEQFRYGFANALEEDEAHRLYDRFAVPGSGTSFLETTHWMTPVPSRTWRK